MYDYDLLEYIGGDSWSTNSVFLVRLIVYTFIIGRRMEEELVSPDQRTESRKYLFLVVCLLLIVVLFGVPVSYGEPLHLTISLLLFAITCVAAWRAGFSSVCTDDVERRLIAFSGGLLILPWILFSFLAGYGPPDAATPAENQLRYSLLLVNASAIAGGFILLKEALRKIGERLYSTLGAIGISLASIMYIVFCAISLAEYRLIERGEFSNTGSAKLIDEISLILLFAAVCLTYLAVAAFVTALQKSSWLGEKVSRIFVGVCFLAVLFVGIKVAVILNNPTDPMWSFSPWYVLPGQLLSIPAVPWIIPCILGVILLRRADAA